MNIVMILVTGGLTLYGFLNEKVVFGWICLFLFLFWIASLIFYEEE